MLPIEKIKEIVDIINDPRLKKLDALVKKEFETLVGKDPAILFEKEKILAKIKCEILAKIESEVLEKIKHVCTIKLSRPASKVAEKEYSKIVGISKTPLQAATIHGFISVVRYLVDELTENKRFSVNDIVIGNQTIFAIAIIEAHEKLATYLAHKTTEFPHDEISGFTALHYVAEKGYVEIADIILNKAPHLINAVSTQGVTALHRAVAYEQIEMMEFLLKRGALPTIKTSRGITPYGMALLSQCPLSIKYFLQHCDTASAINYTYCSTEISPLLFVMIAENVRNKFKQACVEVLLGAGAGLSLERIPRAIFELFDLVQEDDWECLIFGKKINRNGECDIVVITSVNSFIDCLKKENAVSFDVIALQRALQDPLLSSLPHIQKLKELFLLRDSDKTVSNIALESYIPIEKPNLKKNLTLDEYNVQCVIQKVPFINETLHCKLFIKTIFKLLKALSQEEREKFNASHIFDSYFHKLHMMVLLVLNRYFEEHMMGEVGSGLNGNSDKNINDLAMGSFRDVLILLVKYAQTDNGEIKVFLEFSSQLLSIIALFNKTDKHNHLDLYQTFVNARMFFLALIATSYCKKEQYDTAHVLAHKILYEITDNATKKEEDFFVKTLAFVKTVCFSVIGRSCLKEGRVELAIIYLNKALDNSLVDWDTFIEEEGSILVTATQILAEKHPRSMKTDVVEILKKIIDIFENVKSKSENAERIERLFKCFLWVHQGEIEKERKRKESERDEMQAITEMLQLADFFSEDEKRKEPEQASSIQPYSEINHSTSIVLAKRSEPTLIKKEKIKTRKFENHAFAETLSSSSSFEKERIPNHHGFTVPKGFIAPVPIIGGTLPEERLFVTLPENNKEFLPFYPLIKKGYIKCVPNKRGGQGIKLGKETYESGRVSFNDPRFKSKTSTDRAHGHILEEIPVEGGGMKKLYIFDTVVSKKQEQRLAKVKSKATIPPKPKSRRG